MSEPKPAGFIPKWMQNEDFADDLPDFQVGPGEDDGTYTTVDNDPLAIRPRLMEFLKLEPGWLDGNDGVQFTREPLEWLADMFAAYYPGDLPKPRLYPWVDGTLSAEWDAVRLGDSNYDLDGLIDMKHERVEATVTQWWDRSMTSQEFVFDLSTATGWGDWVRLVRNVTERV